jgi:hypothetical protein
VKEFGRDETPVAWGTWEDAEALQRWSFLQKTPEQRLDWLISMLQIAYERGGLKPKRPIDVMASDQDSVP